MPHHAGACGVYKLPFVQVVKPRLHSKKLQTFSNYHIN